MTAVSEGKSRDVPSPRSTEEGRKEGRREREREGRGEMSLPVDPTIPRRLVPDFRTRRNERRTRGAAGTRDGMPQMEKKEPGLYFPLTSERKRRSWSTRSSTNCLRGTGLGINLLLAPRLPLCLFAPFPPIVFFIPNFTRRHATFGWGHCAAARKNFVEFKFAVTNASC